MIARIFAGRKPSGDERGAKASREMHGFRACRVPRGSRDYGDAFLNPFLDRGRMALRSSHRPFECLLHLIRG